MTEQVRTIPDFIAQVTDGGERLFGRQQTAGGSKPLFYRVATARDIPELPLWVDAPDILDKPHASIYGLRGKALSAHSEYRFRFDRDETDVGELYRIGTGLFLISKRILDAILAIDPNSIVTASAIVEAGQRQAESFVVVMPKRVLDVIDTQKTDVRVERLEVKPGSNRFRTSVRFPSGIVVRTDVEPRVRNFVGEYDGNWWWRDDLVAAVKSLGVRGLRAVASTEALIGGAG